MELRNQRELDNTRAKLLRMERLYKTAELDKEGDEDIREAELQSIKRFINQLKEEIARYECRQPARR